MKISSKDIALPRGRFFCAQTNMSAPDLNQLDTLGNNQVNQASGLNNTFGQQQKDFLTGYSGAVKSQPNYLDQYNLLGKQNNLPQLQQNANMVNTAMANIPQTYTAATRGVDVNANQLDQIIGRKAYELSPALTSANNALGTAQNATQQQMQYSQAQQQKELSPYTTEAAMLPQLQSTQAGVFGQGQANQLQALVQKISSGQQLTQTEMQMANNLAVAKMQAENAIDVANIGANAQIGQAKIYGSNQTLGPGSTYYNSSTGQAYNPFVKVPSR